MAAQAMPEFIISPMRVQTLPEITFFYVTSPPIPFSDLDKYLDPLLESLYAAKAQAGLGETGPDIVRYYKAVELLLFGRRIAAQPDGNHHGDQVSRVKERNSQWK